MPPRKVLIVSPHFPPSNLAAVHRGRLFARHLPSFGWEPVIVTVDYRYYEEALDWTLAKLVPAGLRIERVRALPVKPVRLIGDIGIRGFWPMYRRIVQIVRREHVDFLYILIPSNFAALLGRFAHARTGVPYGIDYIDPWVHTWPGTEKTFSKHWWSMKLSEWLEPIAVKRARLITGVAPGYYSDVLERNPHLKGQALAAAMPYGGDAADHQFMRQHPATPYLFSKQQGVIDLVYAGAMLPNAFEPLRQVLRAIAENSSLFSGLRIHFIGTGKSTSDANGYNVRPHAEAAGVYGSVVHEYPARIPYLDVLAHLEAADGVFILGSTDAHYTPSKVYQAVLSAKPILAVLHSQSSARKVIDETRTGVTVAFDGRADVARIGSTFAQAMRRYLDFMRDFDARATDAAAFDEYSAANVTRMLAQTLDRCVQPR